MQAVPQNQLTLLKGLLNHRLASLQADIEAAAAARSRPVDRDVTDRQEDADLRQHAVVDEAQEERDLRELAQVEAALQRLQDGKFGDCADCGEVISASRLLAQPAAERCATCQAKHEIRQNRPA